MSMVTLVEPLPTLTSAHTQRERGVRKQVSVPLICSEPCGDSAENQPVECVVCMPEIVPGESNRTVDSGTKNADYPLSLMLNGRSYLFHFWSDYHPRSSAAEPVKPCVCRCCCRKGKAAAVAMVSRGIRWITHSRCFAQWTFRAP